MDLGALLIGTAFQAGTGALIGKLTGTGLATRIKAAAGAWEADLPPSVTGHSDSPVRPLLQDGNPRRSGEADDRSVLQERKRLTEEILGGSIPTPELWLNALLERWQEVGDQLDPEEAQPFFQLDKDEAEKLIFDLAQRLQSACEQDEELFRSTIHELLREEERQRALGSPWKQPEDYFDPKLNSDKLFHHTWTLVGRKNLIKDLSDFAVGSRPDSDQTLWIAILAGRGGTGKSKVAYALSQRLEEGSALPVRFLRDNHDVEPEALTQLPSQSVLIVADDTHERSDIRTLVEVLYQRLREGYEDRLLLLTRPLGTEQIISDLRRSGIDSSEFVEFEPLGDLTRDQIRALAQEVLGEGYLHHVDHLINVAGNSPLVVTVGGTLLRENHISPSLLESNEDFRYAVLACFQQIITGTVTDQFEPSEVRAVLRLTAALSPVRFESPSFIERASSFLEIDDRKLHAMYDRLEGAGVFSQQGGLIQITPDVLSDHILRDACTSSKGKSTGYAEEVFNQFYKKDGERLLPNLAKVDRRVRESEESPAGILEVVWDTIQQRFEQAENRERLSILKQVEGAARYLPLRALRLVEHAMKQTIQIDDQSRYSFPEPQIVNSLIDILHRIGLNLEYLPRCLQLIWEIAGGEHSVSSHIRHQNSGIRKLTEIAKYRWKIPYRVQEIVLDKAEEWVEEKGTFEKQQVRPLLDVVDPILDKVGDASHSDGHTFYLGAYIVKRNPPLRDLRKRAFRVVQRYATSEHASLRSALYALDVYIKMLDGPTAQANLAVTEESRKRHDADRVWALGAIIQLRNHWHSPILDREIVERTHWHISHGPVTRLLRAQRRLQGLIASIDPDRFEYRLVRFLQDRPYIGDPEDIAEGSAAHILNRDRIREKVVADFIERYPDFKEGERVIREWLSQMISLKGPLKGGRPHPRNFLLCLSTENPKYGLGLAKLTIRAPESPLVRHIGSLIEGVSKSNAHEALTLAQAAIGADEHLAASVARSASVWHNEANANGIDLWGELLQHPGRQVRLDALGALKSFAFDGDYQLVLQQAPRTHVNGDSEVADRLLSLFTHGHCVPHEELNEEKARVLVAKLTYVSRLDKHWIQDFLVHASHQIPKLVFDMLTRKIELDTDPDEQSTLFSFRLSHRSMPGGKDIFEGLRDLDCYPEMLRTIRDYLLHETTNVVVVANLFITLSDNLDSTGQDVLLEWLASDNEQKIRATCWAFESLPYDFALEHSDYVHEVFEAAASQPQEVIGRLRSSFLCAASSEPHRPAQKDVRLRDEAAAIAKDLPPWSEACTLYKEMEREAKERIDRDLRQDEEIEMRGL